MGVFVNPAWLNGTAWVVATLIIGLNVKLLYDFATT